jgi:ubiquitin carboxyl-terminal hydrolase 7
MAAAAASASGPAVDPSGFCAALGIPVLEQQDSQEFWKLLLPALGLPSLADLYQGAYEGYLRALDGSGRERRREEPFLDLSLEVGSSSSDSSVMSGLRALFGSPEMLRVSEGNGWRPDRGSDPVDAHKGSVLKAQGLPSVLQLHLKRFQHDWAADAIRKLNDPVSFPLVLDLKDLCQPEEEASDASQLAEAAVESAGKVTAMATDQENADGSGFVYDLQSVVVHAGEYGSGHYYAYVRPDVRADRWYRFNDHRVEPVAYRDVYADACGGRSGSPAPSDDTDSEDGTSPAGARRRRGWLGRLRSAIMSGPAEYGYGGRTSSAYVLQYVRRSDVPALYELPEREAGQ